MLTTTSGRLTKTGPTMLADIVNLPSPMQAPATIRFSSAMTALFQAQWRASFPGGRSKEQGGTIVADKDGNFSVQHLGGKSSAAGEIDYILNATDPSRFTVVGTFHTHPYDKTEGSLTGMAFSGGDVGLMMNRTDLLMQVLQAGPNLFVHIKTAMTPKGVNQMALHAAVNKQFEALKAVGHSEQEASRIVNRRMTGKGGIAYYEGANGVATRV